MGQIEFELIEWQQFDSYDSFLSLVNVDDFVESLSCLYVEILFGKEKSVESCNVLHHRVKPVTDEFVVFEILDSA